MASIPGLDADVFFGAVDKPLPDWRGPEDLATDEDAEDRPLSDDERRALVSVLGFDPAELDEPTRLSLAPIRLSALTADIAPATTGELADPDVEEILRIATEHLNDLTAQAQADLFDRITSTDPAAALDAVRRLADEYTPLLAAALSEVQLAAVLAGMRRVAERLP